MNNDTFKVHRLNEGGLAKADAVANAFDRLWQEVGALITPVNNALGARERALVVTKLQESCFFAKRALALDPFNLISEATP